MIEGRKWFTSTDVIYPDKAAEDGVVDDNNDFLNEEYESDSGESVVRTYVSATEKKRVGDAAVWEGNVYFIYIC